MGAIKEKIYELAELVYQIMDAGATDQEIDEYVESQISPEEYEFYHAHKDIIMEMIPMMESEKEILMPRLNEDSFDEEEFLMKKGREGNREKYYPGAGDEDLSGEKEFKRDVVYHGRSEMPEDLIDDFDTSRNPDEEAPQSYEDWLDDVYWRISTNYDHDIDEDYTRELFQQHEDELRDIFDSGADVDEATQLITDYDQEENADEYGSYCENCGDEFVDGICPECGSSQEEYGSVDESYIMKSLSEGCNCGGKKRPTLLPNGKRPLLIRRPPIKK